MNQMTFQRFAAWSGVISMVTFIGAFGFAGFIPPLTPSLSPEEVARHYQDHTAGIRTGVAFMIVSGMFYAVYVGVISGQMRRIPGVHPTVVYSQLSAGAFACVTLMIPAVLIAFTAFRPDRDPVLTQQFNDLAWIMLVMPFPPFVAQNFSFAFAILSDTSERPLFPRWLAFVNVWAPLVYSPALLIPFFKSGPFAWSGLLVLWVPACVYILQFIVNLPCLLRAVADEERQSGPAGEWGSWHAHQA
jgi:hypothetical protein